VIAGVLAFICTVNLFTAQGLPNGISNIMPSVSITASAETVPNTVPDITDYYNNAFYGISIVSESSDMQWKVGNFTYGIVSTTVSHEEIDDEGESTSVEDYVEYRIGLVEIDSLVRLTSVKPCTTVTVPTAIKSLLAENEIKLTDPTKCTALCSGALTSGGQYLKEVDLTGIVSIGDGALSECPYITVIDIPESVVYMGEGVFSGSGVKTVNFKNKITEIPNSTFSGTPLGKVTFAYPELIHSIGESAFAGTTLTSYPLSNEKSSEYMTIHNSAFEGCKQIAALTLPDNVVTVGESAFKDCTALKTLKTGKKCNLILASAFEGCKALTSIELNDGLLYLGAAAFSGCTSLVNGPKMPDTLQFKASGLGVDFLEELEKDYREREMLYETFDVYGGGESSCAGIFSGCTALKTVNLPSTWDTVPEGYCSNCTSLTTVVFGENVQNIYKMAFYGCENLQDITLSHIQGYIGEEAFANCKALKAMFSDKVAVIGDEAFSNCESLKQFSMKTIACGHRAFSGCTGLTDVSLTCNMWGSYIFENCTSLKTAYLSLSGARSTPDGIFCNCTSLTSLGKTDLSSIEIVGTQAFYNCQSLTSLALPKVVIVAESAFEDCVNLKQVCSGNITISDYGDNSFKNCLKLTQSVNSAVSTIGVEAFANSGIRALDITGTVGNTLVINDRAFANCDNLKIADITIDDTSIEYEIGDDVFTECSNLTTASYSGTELPTGLFKDCIRLNSVNVPRAIDVRDSVFNGCELLSNIKGTQVFKTIGDSAFAGCAKISKTYADSKTTYSGESQYTGCVGLAKASVYSLTEGMFKGCTGLTNVDLDKNISVVADKAFKNCTALATVNFENVKDFGAESFYNTGVSNLKLVSANTISESAFSNCSKLTNVDIEVDTVGDSAFAECGALAKVSVSTNIIGDSAFKSCKSLYMVSFPETAGYSLREIRQQAFYDTMLSDVLVPSTVTLLGTNSLGFGSSSVEPEEFTIYGTDKSEAKTYADANELKFLDKSKYNADAIIAKKVKPGDINAGGVVSIVDAVLLQRWLVKTPISGAFGPNMDVNDDGNVNVFDLCALKHTLLDDIETEEIG
jgi:hypothetical protein